MGTALYSVCLGGHAYVWEVLRDQNCFTFILLLAFTLLENSNTNKALVTFKYIGKEVGEGFRTRNTCTPVVDACKVKKKKIK